MPPPENMVVSNVRQDRVTGEFSAVVAPRDARKVPLRHGHILTTYRDLQGFRDVCCFLAARESICDALAKAWRRLSVAIDTNEDIFACQELKSAYFAATGKYIDIQPPAEAEPLDDIRRGLGLSSKYGHLSEIEVKVLCRQMDEAAGREYSEAEPIESQARRLAQRLLQDVDKWSFSAETKAKLFLLADELDAGFMVDHGMGMLSEVDRVRRSIPKGSSAGRFTLPQEEKP